MISGPLQELHSEAGEVYYDRRWRLPACVVEPYHFQFGVPEAPYAIDRRLHPDYRTGNHEYDGLQKYYAVSLGPGKLFSSVVPMTPGCHSRYKECIDRVHALAQGRRTISDRAMASWSHYKVQIIKGPAFEFGKKVFRLLESEGPAIPHYIWVAVLCDFDSGVTKCWSFLISNVARPPILDGTIVSASRIERMTGIRLWQHYDDPSVEASKQKIPSKWW